jgi:hypothetical protein
MKKSQTRFVLLYKSPGKSGLQTWPRTFATWSRAWRRLVRLPAGCGGKTGCDWAIRPVRVPA